MDDEATRSRFESLNDEALLNLLRQRNAYTPEAIALAEEEARRRNLDIEAVEQGPDEEEDEGAQIRRLRARLGSWEEEKTVELPRPQSHTDEGELARHIDSLSDDQGPSKRTELPHLVKHILLGIAVAAVGAVLLFGVWPHYAKSDAVVPGASLMFFLGGILLLGGGVVYACYRVYDFFTGKKLGSPSDALATLCRSLEDGNYARTWNCLTPLARGQFGDLPKFRERVKSVLEDMTAETERLIGAKPNVADEDANLFRASVDHNVKFRVGTVSNVREELCAAEFDVIVMQFRRIDKRTSGDAYKKGWTRVMDGTAIFPQITTLVRAGDEWLVADARLRWERRQAETGSDVAGPEVGASDTDVDRVATTADQPLFEGRRP